jgi:hypothetical protein
VEDLSHYKSNLRDIEFNLFEVNRIQDYVGSKAWEGLDRDTMGHILSEVERLAVEAGISSGFRRRWEERLHRPR